jgi:hypothetical protein
MEKARAGIFARTFCSYRPKTRREREDDDEDEEEREKDDENEAEEDWDVTLKWTDQTFGGNLSGRDPA